MPKKTTAVSKSKKKSKKTPKKKTLKIKNAKSGEYFVLVTGTPLKNIKELINALENMNDWVFRHHVTPDRNDFANWIYHVLEEKELAEDISEIKNIKEMEIKMMKYLINKYC